MTAESNAIISANPPAQCSLQGFHTLALGTVPGLSLQWLFWTRGLRQPRERRVVGGGSQCHCSGPQRHPQGNSFAFRNSALG